MKTAVGVRRDCEYHELKPGEYGKAPEGSGLGWICRPYWKHSGGSLRNHQVTEHEDGTITVDPSILIETGPGCSTYKWHGYLEHGVWRECEETVE